MTSYIISVLLSVPVYYDMELRYHYINCKINGHNAKLIVDTASSSTCVFKESRCTHDTVTCHGLIVLPSALEISHCYKMVYAIDAAGSVLANLRDKSLEKLVAKRYDGLLGIDFFVRYKLCYNASAQLITYIATYTSYSRIAKFEVRAGYTCVMVRSGQNDYLMFIDSGYIHNTANINKIVVAATLPIYGYSNRLITASGSARYVNYFIPYCLRSHFIVYDGTIGKYRYTCIASHEDPILIVRDSYFSGTLGLAFLKKERLIIDYASMTILKEHE